MYKVSFMTELHKDIDQASNSLTSKRKPFQHSVTVKKISTHCHPTLNLRYFPRDHAVRGWISQLLFWMLGATASIMKAFPFIMDLLFILQLGFAPL